MVEISLIVVSMALRSQEFLLLTKELPLFGRRFILFVSKNGFQTGIPSLLNMPMAITNSVVCLSKDVHGHLREHFFASEEDCDQWP